MITELNIAQQLNVDFYTGGQPHMWYSACWEVPTMQKGDRNAGYPLNVRGTYNSSKMVDVSHSFLDIDNVGIIRLLLSKTKITTMVDDALSAHSRHSTESLVVTDTLHRAPRSSPSNAARMPSTPTASRPPADRRPTAGRLQTTQ